MRKIFMFLLMIGSIAGLFISCIPTTPSGGDGEAVIEYTESITNQEGIGTFTVSDGQLSVEVLDADTEETIENIECFLSTDGTDAVILLVDPRGEYIPRLTSCQNEYPNKGMLWDGLKLFYMDLKIKFIEGGSHLVYLDEYLPEGLTREILDQQYEHTKTTKFKNLGGILRGSINAWIDFGIGFIETQVVTLVLTPISGVGGALYNIDSDVRTIDEAFESAMISKLTEKYENLGYEPDQYFEIWEAKWPSADFGLFLVLPCGPPKSSIPPTAYIDSIDPNPAQQGETVTFNGHGTDPDGEVWFYRWESDIDGVLSNLKSFNKSDLSVGIHIISFKVFDAAANPSDVVSESLNITPVTTNTYIIIASAGPHGSISPSGNVTVNQGSDKLFTITSDAGYQIADVLVDGSLIGAVSSYTFTNITEDHSISAAFTSAAPGLVHNLTKNTYYNTIQAALDDADNDNTIEVADGTYDETITFPFIKKIILRSIKGASSTIIRGNDGSATVISESPREGTTLEGFTVTHISGNKGRGICTNGNLNIKNCIISGNSAVLVWYIQQNGGGIHNYKGSITITESTISGNTAQDNGGGIFNEGGSITITRSTISGNTADYQGGGIFNREGSITITGSTISDNTADWYGGGIKSYRGSITITGSTISRNSADRYDGGGICSYMDSITITGSTISDNTADRYAGGICFSYWTSGTLSIGGSSDPEKNTICGNYKIGEVLSLDQQIRDDSGSLYETYKDINYISAYCE